MRDNIAGCMLGLAVGDALGAPIELMNLMEIKEKFGPSGVLEMHGFRGFKAGSWTDDTQMSLATAWGCLRAWERGQEKGISDPVTFVYYSYMEWYESQLEEGNKRGAGKTCLASLSSGKMGTIEKPINESKGCGGVMRTAPVGLIYPVQDAFRIGAECAAITHGHPSGYLPAGFLAELIAHLVSGETLIQGIRASRETLRSYLGCEDTDDLIEEALELSMGRENAETAIYLLGEGFTGDEALAIALYCSLKYTDSFLSGVAAAVNHSGDSDSTGSITGAILGSLLGVQEIPDIWLKKLEKRSYIDELVDKISALK